jgi:predicted acetyltransferase
MKLLRLVKPDISLADRLVPYRQEFLDANSSMDGSGSLRHMENSEEWFEQIRMLSDKETVPDNMVLSTQFVYIRESDNTPVGMLQVRHYFNDFLEQFGGNIGYSVRPSERRKGYAKRMLADCLPFCRELGLDKILITCLSDNEASRRTILANHGVYESTVFQPRDKVYLERYWITL